MLCICFGVNAYVVVNGCFFDDDDDDDVCVGV
jgi:hypothetical protein